MENLKIVKVLPSMRNKVFLVRDIKKDLLVYKKLSSRMLKADPLVKELSFLNLGYTAKKRSVGEIKALVEQLDTLGIKHPVFFDSGKNHLLEQYIEGVSIDNIKDTENFRMLSKTVLGDISLLHAHKCVLGDRWIQSQIIDNKNNVYYTDFDVMYLGKNAEELEMAEILNALTYERSFENVVFVAQQFIAIKDKPFKYDVDLMVTILEKHIVYWNDPMGILANLIKVLSRK